MSHSLTTLVGYYRALTSCNPPLGDWLSIRRIANDQAMTDVQRLGAVFDMPAVTATWGHPIDAHPEIPAA